MCRFILVAACAVILSGCGMSLPSFGFLQSTPPTETVRVESNPPGADAASSKGPTCQTPCEFPVPSGSDFVVTMSMNGYRPVTVPVHPETSGGQLQPNPVIAELQPLATKKPAAKKKPRQASPAQSAAKEMPSMAGAQPFSQDPTKAQNVVGSDWR
jgi:hypothetical protein